MLTRENGSYLVRDAESLNGTFVGGLRVARDAYRQLSDGDVLRVGRFWLQVHLEATVVASEMNTRDLALGLISGVLHHLPNEHALRVVEGPRRGELVLLAEGEETVLGRDARSPVRLEGAHVSREHVRVTRRSSGVFVRDGGSRNGSSLGGASLPEGEEVRWSPVAHLQTGNVVLALCGRRPELEALLGLAIEVAPAEATPMPRENGADVDESPAVDDGGMQPLAERDAGVDSRESSATSTPDLGDVAERPAKRRGFSVLVLIPVLALLVLLACLVGVGWVLSS